MVREWDQTGLDPKLEGEVSPSREAIPFIQRLGLLLFGWSIPVLAFAFTEAVQLLRIPNARAASSRSSVPDCRYSGSNGQ